MSCGGRTTTVDEEESPVLVGAVTNREAVALVRAQGGVPATAHLVHIRSNPDGFQNADGRDRRWIVVFWDAVNQVRYFGDVTSAAQEEPLVDVVVDDLQLEQCAPSDQLVQVDSARVVADAVARLPEGYPALVMFFSEDAACFNEVKPASMHRLIVTHPPRDSRYEHSQFYYSDDGSLLQQCGPCEKQLGCPNCSD